MSISFKKNLLSYLIPTVIFFAIFYIQRILRIIYLDSQEKISSVFLLNSRADHFTLTAELKQFKNK